jgi:hypothetical protein
MGDSETRRVSPGLLLFCALVLLAAVIVGGYRIAHRSPGIGGSDTQSAGTYVPTTTPTVTTETVTQPTAATQPASNIVNVRRVVVAGGIRIDVLEMECGLTRVGAGYATMAADPGSQWCLVRVNVKNVSSSPASWSAGGETGYDARGNSFSSESEAELYVSNSNLMGEMNPGVSAPDVIPFELPMNDHLVRISFPGGFNEPSASVSVS